jgi:hypothetical protein
MRASPAFFALRTARWRRAEDSQLGGCPYAGTLGSPGGVDRPDRGVDVDHPIV